MQAPTSHHIDKSTGVMSNASGCYEKRLADMGNIYAGRRAFEAAVAENGEKVVYRVHDVHPEADRGDLIFGTTFMTPGRIENEFFVTRGHIHAKGNRPETYYGESGHGVMLLESPEGKTEILEIAAGTMVYVPPFWIHRSINVGNTPLVMSFCYPNDSGQDYDIIARSGGMAKRIVANGDGWKAIDNAAYRPRSEADIARIYATSD